MRARRKRPLLLAVSAGLLLAVGSGCSKSASTPESASGAVADSSSAVTEAVDSAASDSTTAESTNADSTNADSNTAQSVSVSDPVASSAGLNDASNNSTAAAGSSGQVATTNTTKAIEATNTSAKTSANAPTKTPTTMSDAAALALRQSANSSTSLSVIKTTTTVALKVNSNAVQVAYDATRNEPRPMKETEVAIASPTDVLAMKITGFSYRGVICGFSLKGEAPPSPVTIRQYLTTPQGRYDSGPLKVSWTALDDHAVSGESKQVSSWNFDAEAHANRTGPGWVVSVGGVTAGNGDDAANIPTDGGCELRSEGKVFTASTGPVGYWAGFATP